MRKEDIKLHPEKIVCIGEFGDRDMDDFNKTQKVLKSFPLQDRYWNDTAEFVQIHIRDGEKMIAPDEFELRFPGKTVAYSISLKGKSSFQWAIIHKGMLAEIAAKTLKHITDEFLAVFANEVFVVFTNNSELKKIDPASPHMKYFKQRQMPNRNRINIVNWINKEIIFFGMKNKHNLEQIPALHRFAKRVYHRLLASFPSSNADNNIDYSSLCVDEIKKLMDKRFAENQAYIATFLWDKVRGPEIQRNVIRLISPTNGKKILELGCGIGGNAPIITDCEEYIGTELSEIALAQAREAFGNKPNFKFMAMDAMALKFDDNQFDIVVATEVIEHLPDASKMLKESFRVLKSGGKLLISSPNRDSLHLRVNRILGYSDFKCSTDHVREYTYNEMVNMLTCEGFQVQDTAGVFLQPYWGIPKIDEHVRKLTDNDPQMVEMLRHMGERIGAEYAFCYVILAVKPENKL
jgi:ubiquinone/menaquinone biosynthesis C-methylase UbiE